MRDREGPSAVHDSSGPPPRRPDLSTARRALRLPGLRFADDGDEAAFRQEFNAAALPQVRLAGVLAIVLYAAFGALDLVVVPGHAVPLLLLRIVVIAYTAVVLWLSFALSASALDRCQELMICSVVVVAAAGLDAMPLIAPVPSSYASTGTLLVLMFLFGFARVRFAPALVTTGIVIVGFEVSEVVQAVSWTTAAYNNFFLVGFVVVGASTCYALERLRRREYLYEEGLRGAFGSYVSTELIDRVATGEAIIAPEEVEVTLLFVDIRDFTSFADRSEPSHTVDYLNDFFAVVLPIVRRHGGHANKLLGDGLLAVFGAPTTLADHADRAAAAAVEVLSAVRTRFDGTLRIGIGLDSGTVVAGTVGGAGKLDYTVIGDAVNVASRVEQLTKQTGDPILLTDATRQRMAGTWPTESRGEHQLRGKARPILVHALAIADEAAVPDRARDELMGPAGA